MDYKSIVLEVLQGHRALHERLRESKMIPLTVDCCADHLKARHAFWMTLRGHPKTGPEASQSSSLALERAVQEFRDALPPMRNTSDQDSLSLEEAMQFIGRYTSRT